MQTASETAAVAAGRLGRALAAGSAVLLLAWLAACSDRTPAPEEAGSQAKAREEAAEEFTEEFADEAADPALARIYEPWTGDLEGMVERRYIRVLTVPSPVLYFVDRGRQRGAVFELVRRFENHLNKALARRHVRVHAVILPVPRDELIPRLERGQGDLAIAQLTVTPDRAARVDFSIPERTGVAEVLVTGPAAAPVNSLDDLAGESVYVRLSSSYAEHLAGLNGDLRARGLDPVEIVPADEYLEAGDILEMVSAGLVPATFVDSPLAELYARVFPDLRVHADLAINTGGEIAWALRKDSPELESMVNEFLRSHRQGTLVGNVLITRYLEDTRWVENARRPEAQARVDAMIELFTRYAQRYGLEPMMLLAQAYQESGLDHSKRSPAGAVGIMQMLPSTARDRNVGIPDISGLEDNVHAGAKYLGWIMDRYFDDPDVRLIDRELLALAAYNAGPARVARLRKEAKAQGLDPDQWFNNVEVIAARRIGRETVQYVSNIYKYYLTFKALRAQRDGRREAREAVLGG